MPKVTLPQAAKLTDQATLDATLAVLEQYFDLSADGYLCQTRDLWQVLVSAAAQCTYIETVCNDLATAPTSETVWGYLNDQLTPNVIRRLRGATNITAQSQAWYLSPTTGKLEGDRRPCPPRLSQKRAQRLSVI